MVCDDLRFGLLLTQIFLSQQAVRFAATTQLLING